MRAAEIPDAPINLANIPAQTTAYQIGFEWVEGPYNGGSPVLDFEVWYATERLTEDDPVPTDPLTYSLYTANTQSPHIITSLTPGYIYSVKVKSRNLVGISDFSLPISIQAAQVPDAPINLANVEALTDASQIGLDWDPPVFNGGSALLDYRLWSDETTNGDTFVVIATGLT